MNLVILCGILIALGATVKSAQNVSTVYIFGGSFEDAAFSVNSAIIGQDLVIDFASYVGDMLNRTAVDVRSDHKLFKAADILVFCSAVVTRKVIEADPMNITQYPNGIFVAEREGQVIVSYRNYPDGPMQQVRRLLGGIVKEVMGK